MASEPSAHLLGRTALVTGSSRGIGAATALQLAREGYDVVVTYRVDDAAAAAMQGQIETIGRRCWVHQLDAGEAESIASLGAFVREIGTLDVLVVNAARTVFLPMTSIERKHLEKTFAISVFGFCQLVQEVLPLLTESDQARVVAISGGDTRTWIPGHGALAAAKAAMESMVAYLACELGPLGIGVTAVSPGWVSTDSLRLMLGEYFDEAAAYERRFHPQHREATPDDVASVVAMACGEAASWLSGSVLQADAAGIFAYAGRYMEVATDLMARDAAPDPG